MAASKRGSKSRRSKKSAGGRRKKTSRKTAKPRRARPRLPRAKRPGRLKKPTKIRVAKGPVDTIDLEFTWGGGAEATLMTLVDHQRERLTSRPRDRQRITVQYTCDFGGVHPIQWDLFADSDMKSPILRGRKNGEPIRPLAQTGDTSRWEDRIFL